MVIEESIHINAPIEKVWKTFTDLTCWAGWNTVLQDVPSECSLIEEGSDFSCCLRPYSVPIYFEATIEEVVPYRKVVWAGKKYGISSRHEYTFQNNNGSITVISREEFTGLLVAFQGLFFPKGKIKNLTVTLLEDLKKESEMG